jgi:uncharacterized membrane protein YedE/YeeE
VTIPVLVKKIIVTINNHKTGAIFSFIGGLFLVLGARVAGGCTSGHGISGFGELAINSMLTVPAMFASGIFTAFLLHSLGLYPSNL